MNATSAFNVERHTVDISIYVSPHVKDYLEVVCILPLFLYCTVYLEVLCIHRKADTYGTDKEG